jgi:single-stranded DNA-specific DHH superfamily exonuclease
MSSQSIPLRHIPADVVAVADALAQQTGLSLTAIYRLALSSGILIEATKIPPDRAGTYGGLEGEYLAKALRRHLSSAIDLLLVYGEHPVAARFSVPQEVSANQPTAGSPRATDEGDESLPFDPSLGDDLASLGIGLGLLQE